MKNLRKLAEALDADFKQSNQSAVQDKPTATQIKAETKLAEPPKADDTFPDFTSGGFTGGLLNTPPSIISNPGMTPGVNASLPGGMAQTMQVMQPSGSNMANPSKFGFLENIAKIALLIEESV